MEPLPILVAVTIAVVGWTLVDLLEAWVAARSPYRFAPSMWDEEPAPTPEPLPGLAPETSTSYVVELSDTEVRSKHPDGSLEIVEWDDLQRVELVTTDAGPFAPDVYWLLYGSSDRCLVPQGSSRERELLRRLQQLPGFLDRAVVEGMSSAANRVFVCWKREHGGPTSSGP